MSEAAAEHLVQAAECLGLKQSVSAVILTTVDGRICFWNEAAVQCCGRDSDTVLGAMITDVLMLVHEPPGKSITAELLDKALSRGTASLPSDTLLIDPQGNERAIEGSFSLARDKAGNPAGIICVCHEVTEHRNRARRLSGQYAITKVLSQSEDILGAGPKVLKEVCENIRFHCATLWRISSRENKAHCVAFWARQGLALEEFERATRAFRPGPGEGLPGTIWQKGSPEWVDEFGGNPRFPRFKVAQQCGLKSALAFPITLGSTVFGIIECFSTQKLYVDEDLLRLVVGFGQQIAQFIERTEAEAKLGQREQLYRIITETAGDAIITIDQHSHILTVNQAIEKIFGYDRDELIGNPLTILMPERYREPHRVGLQRYLTTGVKNIPWKGVHLTGLHKSGAEIPLEISFGISWHGDERIITGIMRDISERVQAEAALRNSEERFRLIVESTKDFAIFMMDKQRRVLTWNSAAERILGYSQDEIIGQRADIIFTEEDRMRGMPEVEIRTALEKGVAADERWHIKKDGTQFWGSGTVQPLPSGPEEEPRLLKIMRDMTERKLAEQRIQQINAELDSIVKSRTAELRESYEELEAFTYTIAHDLRNPLRAIQGFAQVLVEDYSSSLDRTGLDYARRISQAGERLGHLIQDLLTYANLGRAVLDAKSVGIKEIVDSIVLELGPEAQARGATILVSDCSSIVLAEQKVLELVLRNLITNAIRSPTPTTSPTVEIWAEARGDMIRTYVKDNGVPVRPEDSERLFDAFERLHAEEQYPGTGIGLAIVRRAVERMAGRTGVLVSPGGGNCFWFELPASTPKAQ